MIWLVVWNMNFIFHFIYGMSSETHWRSPSFFNLSLKPPSSFVCWWNPVFNIFWFQDGWNHRPVIHVNPIWCEGFLSVASPCIPVMLWAMGHDMGILSKLRPVILSKHWSIRRRPWFFSGKGWGKSDGKTQGPELGFGKSPQVGNGWYLRHWWIWVTNGFDGWMKWLLCVWIDGFKMISVTF